MRDVATTVADNPLKAQVNRQVRHFAGKKKVCHGHGMLHEELSKKLIHRNLASVRTTQND